MMHIIKYGDVTTHLKHEITRNTYHKIAIVVDENTYEHCLPLIGNVANNSKVSLIGIKSGEINKNINTAHFIWKKMMEADLDRNSLLINLGGGVICDIGGFCASTYMRGIDFIHVPTTLLAQVDAAIGGKTGIDLDRYKNMVGTIVQPKKVIIDVEFLKTLPTKELMSGFGEMVKHSLLDCMGHYRDLMKLNVPEEIPSQGIVRRSVELKEQIVMSDPKEKNLRKILNFGHTLGHAIETFLLSKNEIVPHGEAVIAGALCALYLSHQLLDLDKKLLDRISKELRDKYPKLPISKSDFDEIIEISKKDKKNINGVNNFVLLDDIGRVKYDIPVNNELMFEALEFYIMES